MGKVTFYATMAFILAGCLLTEMFASDIQPISTIGTVLSPIAKYGVSRAMDFSNTLFVKIKDALPLSVLNTITYTIDIFHTLFHETVYPILHSRIPRFEPYHIFCSENASCYLGRAVHKLQQLICWIGELPWAEWKIIFIMTARQVLQSAKAGTWHAILYIRGLSWGFWFDNTIRVGIYWAKVLLGLLVQGLTAYGHLLYNA
ncbi:hypothetical protein ABEF95_004368 [Exophiala dermatitidis]